MGVSSVFRGPAGGGGTHATPRVTIPLQLGKIMGGKPESNLLKKNKKDEKRIRVGEHLRTSLVLATANEGRSNKLVLGRRRTTMMGCSLGRGREGTEIMVRATLKKGGLE